MQVIWLICYLTVVTAVPLSHERETDERNKFDNAVTSIPKPREFSADGVCRTEHCLNIARRILRNRNASVDPCDDFYEYACGSWNIDHPIPPTEVSWSQDNLDTVQLNEHMRALLEEDDKPNDIEPVKMVRQLYRSCMDVERIEKMGVKPIQDILDAHGGWPMAMPVDKWDSDERPWQEVDSDYLKLFGVSGFFNLGYDVDENNTDRYILAIDLDLQTPYNSLKLQKSKEDLLLFEPEYRYSNGIVRIIRAFAKERGYDLDLDLLIDDITDMVNFEVDLISLNSNDNNTKESDNDFERMTINELQKWYDNITVDRPNAKTNFLSMIQGAFKMVNISVNSSEPILVRKKQLFYTLSDILHNVTERTIVNYLHWNVVNTLLPLTTEEMRLTKYDMSPWGLNVTQDLPRWHICVDLMQMTHAISYMFVNKYFSDKVIHNVTDMIHNIEDEFRSRISHAKWIPDKMKVFMKEKINNIVDLVAYPEWYKNETTLINRYKRIKIGPDFFENTFNCIQDDLRKLMEEFRQKPDRYRWEEFSIYPVTLNAFYFSDTNTMVIPAAILQEPYFTSFLPDAVNYATVGFVIGHELSHSFDTTGIEHDKTGRKMIWSKETTIKGFKDRVECFAKQFNNFTLDITNEIGEPITVNGNLTEDENMADATGLQAAFAAYERLKHMKPQLKLPGLEDTTDEQLFFLSYANAWCTVENPLYAAAMVETDEHSPSRYRIIGSLINTKEFAETYKCPTGSSMNQEQKCSLWN